MDTQNKRGEGAARQELLDELRRLARWKNNDVVKLAFLDGEEADGVDALDLSGVVELRRNANGTFEAKFVDKVRVLGMIRELMEECWTRSGAGRWRTFWTGCTGRRMVTGREQAGILPKAAAGAGLVETGRI